MSATVVSNCCLICQAEVDHKYALYLHVVETTETRHGERHSKEKLPAGFVRLLYTNKKPKGLIHIDCFLKFPAVSSVVEQDSYKFKVIGSNPVPPTRS